MEGRKYIKQLIKFAVKYAYSAVFWLLFTGARIIRTLEWLVKGDRALVKVSWLAIRDGLKGKSGKHTL